VEETEMHKSCGACTEFRLSQSGRASTQRPEFWISWSPFLQKTTHLEGS